LADLVNPTTVYYTWMEELLVEHKVYKLFPSQLQDAKPFETLSTPLENLLQD